MTGSEVQQRCTRRAAEHTGSGRQQDGAFGRYFPRGAGSQQSEYCLKSRGGRVSRGWQHGRSSIGECAGVGAVAVLWSLCILLGGGTVAVLSRSGPGSKGCVGIECWACKRCAGTNSRESVNFSEAKCQVRGACGRTLVAGSGIVFGGERNRSRGVLTECRGKIEVLGFAARKGQARRENHATLLLLLLLLLRHDRAGWDWKGMVISRGAAAQGCAAPRCMLRSASESTHQVAAHPLSPRHPGTSSTSPLVTHPLTSSFPPL